MFRPVSRSLLRTAQSSLSPARTTISGRRLFTTEAPHLRSRSWKSALTRWGLAIGGIYYYNTSSVFAEQPQNNLLNPNLEALEEGNESSSLDLLPPKGSKNKRPVQNADVVHAAADELSSENASLSTSSNSNSAAAVLDSPGPGSIDALEEEAEGEGAFNPETGEINWDCPCLGGMAHGPCGPEFREAFSCFVYSTEEPKGMDCIERFQNMRECFQKHPEVYKDELEDDDDMDEGLEQERKDLAQEIKERKAAVAGQQSDSSQPPRRLLEEAGPAPVSSTPATSGSRSSKSATKLQPKEEKSYGEAPKSKQQSPGKQSSSAQQKTKVADESKEDDSKITVIKQPPSTASDGPDELVPRAAHSAFDSRGPGGKDS